MKIFIRLFLFACLSAHSLAQTHFNVLVYHHVSENSPASTSVSPAKFREHLQFFKDNQFPVIALDEALSAVVQNKTLPKNAIAITFDDAYRSIYHNAFPLLTEFDYPFTIFAATDPIDQKFADMLTWDQLREMKQAGVIIANHSRDHGYLVRHRSLDELWLAQTRLNIEYAQQRLIDELGNDIPNWFAYPYGEFSHSLQALISEMGYVGFAQHSGGVNSASNFTALPRFAAAGIYANTKTLKTKIESVPMPIDESNLSDMLTDNKQPRFHAILTDMSDMNSTVNCFVDGQWQDTVWTGQQSFELVSTEPLSQGRHRYNCTSPSKTLDAFYWYSKPWLIQTKE
ncbi:polysaccharide deacetylase family protein [Reinekea sp.]|jgi:peptidoglycan/xylan/chitin deacetylase (PgdA/CDA1 family)|uniref:polysaccharide deacetylase family protein n=1 Tax=Reinekea sp. TaxID=1970455 RepID=UPI0039897DC4